MELSLLDWCVVAAYFLVTLSIGVYFSRRAGRATDEFFVSGRNLPWWLVGTSMVATTFATDTPNLVTNLVRTGGVKANWSWWVFLLTGMVTVFFYAKLWRRSGVLTDITFYELRYSGKAATFLRGFRSIYLGLLFNVIVMANVTLAAVKVSNILLGLDPYTTIIICCTVTAAYSAFSGLWGVVVTDLLLFVVSMTGAIGAAYYAVNLESVGGLSGLLAHPNVTGQLAILPDFSKWEEVVPLLIIPFAIQWWSVWYPGAEPGGGGYIAQRMLASKSEKHSMKATLWYNIAHYAIRPWPWILVALASLVVFPDLDALRQQFPDVNPDLVRDDLAYPAMLTFVPAGMLGIVVASLAAAYMSTISTHLNWGASYLVEDFYKRFISNQQSEKHYVMVGRIITVILMVLACGLSFWLQDALQGFTILLQIGAGTGSIYLLRWFWWRVNAWSEITGMFVSFAVAFIFEFGFPDVVHWQRLTIGVAITTASWLLATFLTPSTKQDVMQSFFDKVKPMPLGWKKVVNTEGYTGQGELTSGLICVMCGCFAVYFALFGLGYFLYGNVLITIVLAALCIASAVGVIRFMPSLK